MGSSVLEVEPLLELTTFSSSVTVVPLLLNQIAFSVVSLFLDSSSNVASLRHYALLSMRKLSAE